jgi:hypothetical protein
VANSPPRAQSGRLTGVAFLGSDERGDGDEVVRIRRVAQAEQECNAEGYEERRAVEEAREPGIERVDGSE